MSARTLKCVVRMWGLLFVVCTLLPSLICKEYAPAVELGDDEKDTIYRVIKRLENSGLRNKSTREQDHHHEDDTEPQSCDAAITVHEGTIIRSDDSISNGAEFLGMVKGVESNGACADYCCKKSSCDTAVLENKGEHKCYLFRCLGKCLFGSHRNYSSSAIVKHAPSSSTPAPLTDNDEVIDLDLDSDGDGSDLDSDGSNKDGDATHSPESVTVKGKNTTAVSASTSTSAAPTVATTYILPHSVMLGGACYRDLHCRDPRAECNFRQCVCRRGLQQKDGICREQCPVGSFECQTPVDDDIQCISEEERCDSIEQCADGSDEYNCFVSGKWVEGVDTNSSSKESEELDEGKEQKVQEKNDTSVKPEEQGQPDSEHSSEELNTAEDDQKENQHSLEEENQSGSEEEKQEESQHGSEEGGKTDSEEEPQKEKPISSEEESHVGVVSTQPTADLTTPGVASTTTTHNSHFIFKEKIAEIMDSDLQVPIIALSVGLAFTLILLIYVACRLCRVRRQLRKGRPLHCNEADYLINGMYL